MTIGGPAFCLFLYLTGAHFQGKLQHVGQVGEQNIQSIDQSEHQK